MRPIWASPLPVSKGTKAGLYPCSEHGCTELLQAPGKCAAHAEAAKPFAGYQRHGSSASRGYNGAWRKARISYLYANPLCVQCKASGRLRPATLVDHIIPHEGDYDLFWNRDNWQALCSQCHNAKTGREIRQRGLANVC